MTVCESSGKAEISNCEVVHKCTAETLSSFAGHAFLQQVTFWLVRTRHSAYHGINMMEQTILDYCSTIVSITVETNIPVYKVDFCCNAPQFCGSWRQGEKIHFTERRWKDLDRLHVNSWMENSYDSKFLNRNV